MRKTVLTAALASLITGLVAAYADVNYNPAGSTVIFAFTCFTSKVCPAHVITNSAGTEIAGTYGTAPGAVPALNVNASVTNANANGQAVMANSSPVVIASNQSSVPITPLSTTNAGAPTVKGGVGVVNGGSTYQHIAASQTAAVLQTSTGAAGDYLSHCVIYPSTTGAGSVTVFDNANAAATNVIEFTSGTLSNLAPIVIPVGAVSTAGAWKVTTGANETVVCYGKFS